MTALPAEADPRRAVAVAYRLPRDAGASLSDRAAHAFTDAMALGFLGPPPLRSSAGRSS